VAFLFASVTARPAAAAPLEDPAATRLMTMIEHAIRSGSRLFSVDVEITTASQFKTARRMLGVSHQDGRATHVLYVITAPPLVRGTTLLIRDSLDARQPDRMWFSLAAMRAVREVQASSLRLLVPGTGLTFEESRGWIATDKYRFATLASAGDEVTVEAWPSSDSLARVLGTSRLVVRADPRRDVVRSVTFYDEAGNLVKTFEAREFLRVAGRWYPQRVRVVETSQRLDATLSYRYAALMRPPPAELFRADTSAAPFLDRLLKWMQRSGYARDFPDTLPHP
jgi:hypothetical protein